ncbi:MAG: hypothetical protein ACP5T0_12355 [Verrucomicrobiia bacterium]
MSMTNLAHLEIQFSRVADGPEFNGWGEIQFLKNLKLNLMTE